MKKILTVDSEGNFEIEDAAVNGNMRGSATRKHKFSFVLGIEIGEHGEYELEVIKSRGNPKAV